MRNYYSIKKTALKVRKLIIDCISDAGSGHPGGSLSMVEILGCLFYNHIKYNPKNPEWNKRDKLILSKGHASPGLFSYLAMMGYFEIDKLSTFRKFGSMLQGHPNLQCPGVEFCGGSLGIGLSFSIGDALAARIDNSSRRIYTIIGDGESDEGQIWEAAMSAAKYGIDNLTVILDRNYVQQDSHTEDIMPLDAIAENTNTENSIYTIKNKWKSFGWNVIDIDGHKIEQIDYAIRESKKIKNKPSIIIANTVKGKGIDHMEHNPNWHGQAPQREFIPLIDTELNSQFMIAPSIIAGYSSDLQNKIKLCEHAKADYIHLDVMDGIFVNNKTFDFKKIKELRNVTNLPFDVHLMISNPLKYIMKYIDAGSDIISVHVEACNESSFGEIHDILQNHGMGIGLAINPDTKLPEWSYNFLTSLDQLIVMSVQPGKSGQKYIETTHAKTQSLFHTLHKYKFEGYIEADGGVCQTNIGQCFIDGARIFVGGNAIVGQSNVQNAITEFRNTILYTIKKLLISQANKIGGSKFIEKWINLHNKEKSSMINNIATDLGYM